MIKRLTNFYLICIFRLYLIPFKKKYENELKELFYQDSSKPSNWHECNQELFSSVKEVDEIVGGNYNTSLITEYIIKNWYILPENLKKDLVKPVRRLVFIKKLLPKRVIKSKNFNVVSDHIYEM